jgi:hypothetical protein
VPAAAVPAAVAPADPAAAAFFGSVAAVAATLTGTPLLASPIRVNVAAVTIVCAWLSDLLLRKRHDRLRLAVLQDFEVVRREVPDRLPLAVADGDVHEDQIDAAPERRRLLPDHERRRRENEDDQAGENTCLHVRT